MAILVTWDDFDLDGRMLRHLGLPDIVLSVVRHRLHYLLQQSQKEEARSGLSCSSGKILQELVDRKLVDASPVEKLANTDLLEESLVDGLMSSDFHHLFQLHVIAVGVTCWTLGIKNCGHPDERVRLFILDCLKWLRYDYHTAIDSVKL